MDRADRVVEPALVDEVLGAILGAQDEVDLEAKPKRRRADELAIGDEIVARLLLPERVTPQLERLGEPVDVLGDAELVNAGLASGRQVPLDVPVGERGRVRRFQPLPCRMLRDLAILVAAFAAGSALAAALGAVNLGTALSFGQIAFALALAWVLLRR